MRNLKDNELMNVSGGGCLAWAAGIGAGIAFIIGILDGMVRPLKCR